MKKTKNVRGPKARIYLTLRTMSPRKKSVDYGPYS